MGWLFAWQSCITQPLIIFAKAFITYFIVTVPADDIQAADVFETGIFH